MQEIRLSVKKEHLETVLTILDNLKSGLIDKIERDVEKKSTRVHYKPKMQKVIYEEESGTNDTHGKYASAATYKQRLKNQK